MDALTLDQIRVFLSVVDEGSFPKAAKSLQRGKSTVTDAIRKLEAEIGGPLFDRSAYRSVLTPAGRALLTRARRIAEEAGAFREQARGLASGLEAELSIVLDALYPMPQIFDAHRAFTEQFPTVPPRLYVASLGAAADMVTDGTCAIGLLPSNIAELAALKLTPTTTFHLCPVVSPSHPLASIQGIIEPHVLRQHVQLVLTDASTLTAAKDWGVLSSRTWRLADLGAKKSMLLAGLGWGNMPAHMIEDEIKDGRLTVIQPAGFDSLTPLVLGAAYISKHSLGPAGRGVVTYPTSVASVARGGLGGKHCGAVQSRLTLAVGDRTPENLKIDLPSPSRSSLDSLL